MGSYIDFLFGIRTPTSVITLSRINYAAIALGVPTVTDIADFPFFSPIIISVLFLVTILGESLY